MTEKFIPFHYLPGIEENDDDIIESQEEEEEEDDDDDDDGSEVYQAVEVYRLSAIDFLEIGEGMDKSSLLMQYSGLERDLEVLNNPSVIGQQYSRIESEIIKGEIEKAMMYLRWIITKN